MRTLESAEAVDRPLEYYNRFCVYCGSTDIILKDKVGTKKGGKNIRRRRYHCKRCGRKFRWGAFVKMKKTAELVVNVLKDLAVGLWFRSAAERAGISPATVAKMLTKFVPYLNSFEKWASPQLSLTLQLDDMWSTLADDYSFINLHGQGIIDGLIENNQVAVTNVKDVANLYWIATVAGLDNTDTLTAALVKTLKLYNPKPKDKITITTDDHPLYRMLIGYFPLFNHVYHSKKENIAIINSIERTNRTARKIIPHHVRRFRTVDLMQKTLDVLRFEYNFIRTQKSLGGKTPAEAARCGPLWGKCKWRTAVNIGYVETIKSRLDSFKSQDSKQNFVQTNADRSRDSKLAKYF